MPPRESRSLQSRLRKAGSELGCTSPSRRDRRNWHFPSSSAPLRKIIILLRCLSLWWLRLRMKTRRLLSVATNGYLGLWEFQVIGRFETRRWETSLILRFGHRRVESGTKMPFQALVSLRPGTLFRGLPLPGHCPPRKRKVFGEDVFCQLVHRRIFVH